MINENTSEIRVRFAPSPTGGLHIGGVRTVLFNYLFAKQHNGKFILRIEDTDQSRLVEGAEAYIIECLDWCGLMADEGPHVGGPFEPYRQSERKEIYKKYADQLIQQGNAYYAFDTSEDLEQKRAEIPNFQYGQHTRLQMRNSLTLSEKEVAELVQNNTPHVIRIKMPEEEQITFTDMIRGEVTFDSNLVDDKVLLKADGMPTYHLAVVVDDYSMKISHAFRGEEWLPSAPVHILLWEYLGWKNQMPQWAHLPLILKPDGNGKLSKRDGERLGFPVFATNWTDPKTGQTTGGFREMGFLPEAFINFLAVLGWNDGTEQELFSLEELIQKFDIKRINKAGAKFDFEKAKWFNTEWIKRSDRQMLLPALKVQLAENGVSATDDYLLKAFDLVRDRLTFTNDFWTQAAFLFKSPEEIDLESIKPKWNPEKTTFFHQFINHPEFNNQSDSVALEALFKQIALEQNLKVGEVMLPLRIFLVGGKFGPGVFDIVQFLGEEETSKRILTGLTQL